MEIDPFENLFNADISESQNSTGDEPLPAGDHILNINYHKIERKGWAESEGNPTGTVVVVGFGKPGHGLTFENFSVDPEKWGRGYSIPDFTGVPDDVLQLAVPSCCTCCGRPNQKESSGGSNSPCIATSGAVNCSTGAR